MHVLVHRLMILACVASMGAGVFQARAGQAPTVPTAADVMASAVSSQDLRRDKAVAIDDRTFIRRMSLDLTGRLPDRARTSAFLADTRTDKYARLIDELIASQAFTERWTTFFGDLFQNTMLIEESGMYRNAFHKLLRDQVATNTPVDAMMRSIIAGHGLANEPASASVFWAKEAFVEGFRPDYIDDTAAIMSQTMLGIQIECISCHDGQGHLETVNVGLSQMKRKDFWGLAAFLSSVYFYHPEKFEDDKAKWAKEGEEDDEEEGEEGEDGEDDEDGDDDEGEEDEEEEEDEFAEIHRFYSQIQVVDMDRPGFDPRSGSLFPILEFDSFEYNLDPKLYDGQYHAETQPGQGMRPARRGGVIAPKYPFTGEQPRAGEGRREALARILTADRQFARNWVNRIWAHFFGEGFVEPLDGFDLTRLDPEVAQANGTTVQPKDPYLMEYLTDWFIDHGYDLRGLVRLIANSKLYQWNYADYEPGTAPSGKRWAYWRDTKRVRRLDAETIVDGIWQVLGRQPTYVVAGMGRTPYHSAWAMPDPTEPSPLALATLFPNYEEGDEKTAEFPSVGKVEVEELYLYMFVAQELQISFGRGDYFLSRARGNESTVQNALMMMNGFPIAIFMEYPEISPLVMTLSRQLAEEAITKRQMATYLFEDVLFRSATERELQAVLRGIESAEPLEAVVDTLWVLFNHPDFLYR